MPDVKSDSSAGTAAAPPPAAPAAATEERDTKNKRKRVTRACDECRKKKVRCDGKQPCIHCSVYALNCTFNQPTNRKKPDESKGEAKLKVAEQVLQSLLPGVDIFAPGFDLNEALERQKNHPVSDSRSPKSSISLMHSASPSSNMSDSWTRSIKIILPPKHVAVTLIETVWEHCCVLFRFYHRPSFIRDMDLLYETDPDDYTDKEFKILPLVYSIMAVGVLFSADKSEQIALQDSTEGYKYFVAARDMIDITDVRETYAIQSIVMMVLFLQCSGRLSTCYSYIGVAMRSALRSGLHRKIMHPFNPIELETRKRLFYTIRKMDIYVNAMLGLPGSIVEADFDQDMPLEIDDENITEDGYYPQQNARLSSVGMANAHTKLMDILAKIMAKIYPVRSEKNNFSVCHQHIEELERELWKWRQELPPELASNGSVEPEYLKANRLLSLTYCNVSIVLYRPLIHYSSPRFTGRDSKSRLYAMKCVAVARKAMHIADDLAKKQLLNSAYWYAIYTIFFAIACLLYFLHENPLHPESAAIRADAELGKNALNMLKESSMAARKTYAMLNTLFDQLNQRTAIIDGEGPTRPTLEYQGIRDAQDPDASPAGNVLGGGLLSEEELGAYQHTPDVAEVALDDLFADYWPAAATANGAGGAQSKFGPRSGVGIAPGAIPGVPNTRMAPNIPGAPTNWTGSDPSPDEVYVPGLMDKVDSQLFGKFLPSYMMDSYVNSAPANSAPANPTEPVLVPAVNPQNNRQHAHNGQASDHHKQRKRRRTRASDGNVSNIEDPLSQLTTPQISRTGSPIIHAPNQVINNGVNGLSSIPSTLPTPLPQSLDSGLGTANNGTAPLGQEQTDRKLSLSNIFSDGWDDIFLQGANNELSGLNGSSLM